MEDKLFDSFDIRNEYGKLTNAGALLADDSPIRHSRLFCTRWNGSDKSVAITTDYVAIEAAIDGLNASQTTIQKAKAVYKNMGTDGIFGRSDMSSITGDSVTASGNLITKLKAASLIVPVKGYGKGKYRFIEPHK